MSDVMFYGVLRMPYEMAMADEISRFQFYSRVQEAVDRVEKAEAQLATSATASAVPPEDRFCDANCVWTDHHPDCKYASGTAMQPCQNEAMKPHQCQNRHQCWEPCGELGHSAEHARVSRRSTPMPDPYITELIDRLRDKWDIIPDMTVRQSNAQLVCLCDEAADALEAAYNIKGLT